MERGAFIEVCIDRPLEECARRGAKGLYKRVLSDDICNVAGIISACEASEKPELRLKSTGAQREMPAMQIQELLERRWQIHDDDA
ncbi:adenylyl-sulfate kinase [Neorhizobium sp. T786]|nr:adenylyl-sulfate kinase [Neorhizobium xiangyangii]